GTGRPARHRGSAGRQAGRPPRRPALSRRVVVPAAAQVQGRMTDAAAVEALLGRPPQGSYDVVVRDGAGRPVVIRNAPLLDDGTPMPTRWWLVGEDERRLVSRIEADGGVKAA